MLDKYYLKPCPFCGKPAEMIETKHIPEGIDYTPRCTDTSCPGRCSKKYTDKDAAYTKWNNRSKPTVYREDVIDSFSIGDMVASDSTPNLIGTITNLSAKGSRHYGLAIVDVKGKRVLAHLDKWHKVEKEKKQ